MRMLLQPFRRTVLDEFALGPASWWSADDFVYEQTIHYLYTPTFTILYTPFWILPAGVGAALWALLGLVALYFGTQTLMRRVLPVCWGEREAAIWSWLVLWGAFRGLWSGQSNALIVGLACWGLNYVLNKQWWRAALCLALPVFIKLWPLALVLLLAVNFRRLIVPFAAVSAPLAALPWLTRTSQFVWRQYAGYVEMLIHRRQDERLPGYRDFWTLWEQFAPPDAWLYKVLQLTAALAAATVCWLLARRVSCLKNKHASELPATQILLTCTFAVWACWQLLFGPGSERLTLGLLAPIAAWAVIAGWSEFRAAQLSSSRSRYGAACVLAAAGWLAVYLIGTGEIERALIHAGWVSAAAIVPAGIMLCGAAAMVLVWRRTRGMGLESLS